MLLFGAFANAQCGSNCFFYGGDLDPHDPNANGLGNENDALVGGTPYGAATYQNFTTPAFFGNIIYGLFSNNLSGLNPTTGYWEIRSGVSEGNGGTLVTSGTGAMNQTPTGRSDFGYTEYRDEVDGLHVALKGGIEYWFSVVPNDPMSANRSYNSNTVGLNALGKQTSNQQFWNSPYFGANFTNADNEGVFPTFSIGVLTIEPEPSTMITFASGLVAVASLIRRRLTR